MRTLFVRIAFIGIPLFTVGAVLFYLNSHYHKLNSRVESIRVVLSKPLKSNSPIVYVLDSTEAMMNLSTPLVSKSKSDSVLIFDLINPAKLRQFRIYFPPTSEEISIKSINPGPNEKISLTAFTSDQMEVLKKAEDEFIIKIIGTNGYSYIESPRLYYPTDYSLIVASTVITILIFWLLLLLVSRFKLFSLLGSLSLLEVSVIAFIFSIFLPQRLFNISLTISILLHIRNFKPKIFWANKLNIFLISFYLVILFNFLLISPDYNFKAIEKYTILLILPIYISCIKSDRVGIFFSISALIIGGILLFGALIDISIFRNFEIIAFDNFTRGIHPIYYSYLIAFSIIYVELTVSESYKYLIQLSLALLLILSGSKIIILTTLLIFVFNIKRKVNLIIVMVVIFGLLFFTPTRTRMESVLDFGDLSVIQEQTIKDPHDSRLNGFTLRIILWQESLNISNAKELIFGRGVSLSGNKSLERSLERRGLTDHLWYNAHNQYITTMYEMGLIGFILLMALLVYTIRLAVSTKDRVLLAFTLLMSIAMLSESILKRASGIAFFCMVILLLSNTRMSESKKS